MGTSFSVALSPISIEKESASSSQVKIAHGFALRFDPSIISKRLIAAPSPLQHFPHLSNMAFA